MQQLSMKPRRRLLEPDYVMLASLSGRGVQLLRLSHAAYMKRARGLTSVPLTMCSSITRRWLYLSALRRRNQPQSKTAAWGGAVHTDAFSEGLMH